MSILRFPRLAWLLAGLIVAEALIGQDTPDDSLLRSLPAGLNDRLRAAYCLEKGDSLVNNQPALARRYYNLSADWYLQLHDSSGYYRFLVARGRSFLVEGKPDSNLFYQGQALQLARQMGDSLKVGSALLNMGVSYRESGDFPQAIAYCLRGKELLEKASDPRLKVTVNDALQVLYQYQSEYKKSVEFGEAAVAAARKLNDKTLLASTLINLSMSYTELKEYAKSRQLLEEALRLSQQLGNQRYEASALLNLGGNALKEQDFNQLYTYAEKSLALYRKTGSLNGQVTSLRALALCYLQRKDLPKAQSYADTAFRLAAENGFGQEQASLYRIYAAIAYMKNDPRKGNQYDQESDDFLTKMVNEILSRQSAGLEKKYETREKESRIRQLEAEKKIQQLSIQKKNMLNLVLAAGFLALGLLSILLYRNYGHRQKLQQKRIKELETEKKLMATEAVLKGEEQERSRLARDLHDGLGGMLSGIKYSLNSVKGNLVLTSDNALAFERSLDMLDSSILEMRRVAHNMMPEALVKFGLDVALRDFCDSVSRSGALKLDYQSIGMEGLDLDQTSSITLYRIVQELVNNILKHAGAQSAIVQLSARERLLSITVEDDGRGFDPSLLKSGKGMGWLNIRSRVDFLKGKIDVHSDPGKGSSVLIELIV